MFILYKTNVKKKHNSYRITINPVYHSSPVTWIRRRCFVGGCDGTERGLFFYHARGLGLPKTVIIIIIISVRLESEASGTTL